MGWEVGFDQDKDRWVGYGVPTVCEHPKCNNEIHRGLSYVCGGEAFGGETGCGLFFCSKHLMMSDSQVCESCFYESEPFKMKPEHPDWINHLLNDESWSKWRDDNPDKVEKLKKGV